MRINQCKRDRSTVRLESGPSSHSLSLTKEIEQNQEPSSTPVFTTDYDGAYWDTVARCMIDEPHYMDPIIAKQKRQAHLELIMGWLPANAKQILKTDLFEEAFGDDALLPYFHRSGGQTVGMDISPRVMANAARRGLSPHSVVCDVRELPYAEGSFDAIISTSTLDHFANSTDITASLSQCRRVLRPGGILIVTLDNRQNFLDWLMRLVYQVGVVPYHIGPSYSMQELKSSLAQVGFTTTDTAALIHNPRIVTTGLVKMLRFARGESADRSIQFLLDMFDGMRNWPTRYRTACFIAARAERK